MSYWRPSPLKNIFVIPDVHGQLDQLKLILKRIIPLRRYDGAHDILVMLGDYIDRLPESHLVVDLLIDLKKKCKDQLILLKGNHEEMLLNAIKHNLDSHDYRMWMDNGGEQTLSGYLERANQKTDNPYTLPRNRIANFIPPEHLDFFNSLLPFYETDEYIFVHGGCEPMRPLKHQSPHNLIWDRMLFESICTEYLPTKKPLPWPKTIITGHNTNEKGIPFVTDKFMMLDCSKARKLLVVELNSMECKVAQNKKKALVAYNLIDQYSV